MEHQNLTRFLKRYQDFQKTELDELGYIRHVKNVEYMKELIQKIQQSGMGADSIDLVKKVDELESALKDSVIKREQQHFQPLENKKQIIPKLWRRVGRKTGELEDHGSSTINAELDERESKDM
ncbi:hypothetical protein HDU67_001896 [Dinochytrium kinnereticum]|nr:hypothetical protein HDU67_001896 [Dinochytrium kinnereticum]